MARIPAEELERLKREIAIERLAAARGIVLSRRGADLVGLCPFHDDKSPSLVVTPAKNLWHCLGACQAGGSVIDWVMKAEGVSFRHAVELLRRDAPALAKPSSSPPPEHSTVAKLPRLLVPHAEDADLLARVVDHYHAALLESAEARGYLASRGLGSESAIRHFRLGVADRTLGYHLPAKTRKEGLAIRERLQALGVLRASGHEHLNGSLVVPVFDEDGNVAELYGRKITRNLRPGTPDHLYLPGPHRGVWNWPALRESDEIILCESLLDALTFWEAGFRHVTASYGTQGFTKDHREAFRRHGIRRVLIAYDRDAAGEEAAQQLAKTLQSDGIGSYRILFPKGMDANAYAQKVQPAAKALEILIRKAEWLGKGQAPAVVTQRAEMTTTIEVREELSAAKDEEEEVEVFPEIVADAPATPGPTETSSLAADSMPAATPEPRAVSKPLPEAQVHGDEVVIALGDRRWRVRGLAKNATPEQLRVNLLVARGAKESGVPDGFHIDTLDLYAAKPRAAFVAQAADELGCEPRVVKKDLGQVLLVLEGLQEEARKEAEAAAASVPEMSEAEHAEAMALLRDPNLLDRILADFARCGVVGEETNKLVGYLAAVSRKLDQPLAVVIQSSSAAGKSWLMESILAFVPEEERVQYSAMTGQSLFYLGEGDLAHKILAIVEEEGAERASYALKLLQSEGRLSIASTGKDPQTGRLVTHTYHVQGPVMIFLTTTAIEIDEELLNRCLVLSVDEGREQTRAIHRLQRERETLAGLLAVRERERILNIHRNAQRLLRPLLVANPYAPALTFLDHRTRTRRDHVKYLTLIRAVALLHQHQREVRTAQHSGEVVAYLEVTKQDIAVANRLAHAVLGRSLDELPAQTRKLLGLVEAHVKQRAEAEGLEPCDVRFTRRALREATGWGDTQLKVHLHRLAELEYVVAHRGGMQQRFLYELVERGAVHDDERLLPGLLDANTLECEYDAERSGGGRPVVGGRSGGGRSSENTGKRNSNEEIGAGGRPEREITAPGTIANPSYTTLAAAARG